MSGDMGGRDGLGVANTLKVGPCPVTVMLVLGSMVGTVTSVTGPLMQTRLMRILGSSETLSRGYARGIQFGI